MTTQKVKPKDCVTLPEFLTKRMVENAGPSSGLLELYNPKDETTKELHTLMKDSCDQWYASEFDKKRK